MKKFRGKFHKIKITLLRNVRKMKIKSIDILIWNSSSHVPLVLEGFLLLPNQRKRRFHFLACIFFLSPSNVTELKTKQQQN